MKLTVNAFLSLDGVMQGPGGPDEDVSGGFDRGGWLVNLADEGMDEIVTGWFADADAFLLGRTTYDMMAAYWPQVAGEFVLNTLPKYVASSTLQNPTWNNTTVLEGPVLAAVAALKERPGRELQVHGSCALARSLYDAGLVDEYRLLVFPVIVGDGKRLFEPGSTPTTMDLVGTQTTPSGAVCSTFLPKGGLSKGTFFIEDGKEAAKSL